MSDRVMSTRCEAREAVANTTENESRVNTSRSTEFSIVPQQIKRFPSILFSLGSCIPSTELAASLQRNLLQNEVLKVVPSAP
jgi:hypothetical protein